MKKYLFVSIVLAASLSFSGCGDSDDNQSSSLPSGGVVDFGVDVVTDAAKDYLKSKVLEAFGMDKDESTEQFSEIIQDIQNLEADIENIQKSVDEIISDFSQLDTYLAKTDYKNYANNLSDMGTEVNTIWNSYMLAFGDNKSSPLEDRVYSKDVCQAFKANVAQDTLYNPNSTSEAPLFEAIANMLANFSNQGEGQSYIPALTEVTQQYLLGQFLPQVGTKSASLKDTLDKYNESIMNQYAIVLSTLQKFFMFEQTLLYMGSKDTKVDECYSELDGYWVQHGTNISADNNYLDNVNSLKEDYNKAVVAIKNAINAAIISDKLTGHLKPLSDSDITTSWVEAKDLNTKIKNQHGDSNYIPNGSWRDGCILYQWDGFKDWSGEFKGDYDGEVLTARCTYDSKSETSTLDMKTRCFDYTTDEPDMTDTASPYLECQYLNTANLMSINKVHSVMTGYSPLNATIASMDENFVIKDFIAFNSTTQIAFPSTKYASSSYVSQFMQINFDNKEKVLVQVDSKAQNGSPDGHYLSFQCGNSLNVEGEKYWSCGNNHSTDNPSKTEGDSEQYITTYSGEKTVEARVDGGGLNVGNAYFSLSFQ